MKEVKVGQKLKSKHCKGKEATVKRYNSETGAILVVCDCGVEYIVLPKEGEKK